MDVANSTFILLSSASAATLMGVLFSYAKSISDRKNKLKENENKTLEELIETIVNFISDVDLFFENLAQEFESAKQIDITDEYDKEYGIKMKYYKKTYSIDRELIKGLWSSYYSVKMKFSRFGKSEYLSDMDEAMKLIRSIKYGEPYIIKEIPTIRFNETSGEFIGRLLFYLSVVPGTKIVSGTDVKESKKEWEKTSESLIKSLKWAFNDIQKRIEKNREITDSFGKISIISVYVFMSILFAEAALYLLDYVPKLLFNIGDLIRYFNR